MGGMKTYTVLLINGILTVVAFATLVVAGFAVQSLHSPSMLVLAIVSLAVGALCTAIGLAMSLAALLTLPNS